MTRNSAHWLSILETRSVSEDKPTKNAALAHASDYHLDADPSAAVIGKIDLRGWKTPWVDSLIEPKIEVARVLEMVTRSVSEDKL